MTVKHFKTKKTTLKKVLKTLSKSKSKSNSSYKKTKKSMHGGKFKSMGSWKSMSGGSYNGHSSRKRNLKYKKKKSKSKSNYKYKFNSKSKKHLKQKGGFLNDDNCSLATIKEPGFHLEGSGNIEGISIPESRAVIYNPDCKVDTYQAMTP
jgi:hypothetical protein